MFILRNSYNVQVGVKAGLKFISGEGYIVPKYDKKKRFKIPLDNFNIEEVTTDEMKSIAKMYGTEVGGKVGWALGPVGVGIGSAVGSLFDESKKKKSRVFKVTQDDGSYFDMMIDDKEIRKFAEVAPELYKRVIDIL